MVMTIYRLYKSLLPPPKKKTIRALYKYIANIHMLHFQKLEFSLLNNSL